jgi:hypothetical protein
MPLAKLIIPNVTIKGAILTFDTMNPVIAPKLVEIIRASNMAIPTGMFLINPATNTPEIATVDPTERSMPPVRITNSIPMLTTILSVTWTKRFCILAFEKKTGDIREATRMINAKTAIGTSCILKYDLNILDEALLPFALNEGICSTIYI